MFENFLFSKNDYEHQATFLIVTHANDLASFFGIAVSFSSLSAKAKFWSQLHSKKKKKLRFHIELLKPCLELHSSLCTSEYGKGKNVFKNSVLYVSACIYEQRS